MYYCMALGVGNKLVYSKLIGAPVWSFTAQLSGIEPTLVGAPSVDA